MCTKYWFEPLKGRDHSKDLGVDGRNQKGSQQSRFRGCGLNSSGLQYGQMVGCCEHGNETSSFISVFLTSQEVCIMELVGLVGYLIRNPFILLSCVMERLNSLRDVALEKTNMTSQLRAHFMRCEQTTHNRHRVCIYRN
jgi:hypothetical protein